jgi:predicted ATPase
LQFHKNPIFRPCTLGGLSEIYLRAGEPERGLEVIAEGLDIIARTGECWWEAELHRLKGELMRASGAEISKVEDSLRFALQIAGRQEARSLKLRSATSLARLCAIRAGGPRPMQSSPRSTAGSPRASTRPTSRMPRRC